MNSLENQFSRDEGRHSKWLREQKWFIKARKDHERREEFTVRHEGDSAIASAIMVVATEESIRNIEIKLDKYEAATVNSLMFNQKQLDTVNAHIELLLSKAYVMDDGRRVFKTEDGKQVFDEHGQEVSQDDLDFDLIGPDYPSWEEYSLEEGRKEELLAEREDLLTYQEELDGARERISEGGLSEAELEEMDAELMDLMPESVREQVPEIAQTISTPDLATPAALPETPSRQIGPQVLTPIQ